MKGWELKPLGVLVLLSLLFLLTYAGYQLFKHYQRQGGESPSG
jgi:hypothetical protein